MDTSGSEYTPFLLAILSLLMAIIGFFLRDLVQRIKKHEDQIKHLEIAQAKISGEIKRIDEHINTSLIGIHEMFREIKADLKENRIGQQEIKQLLDKHEK